MPLRVLKVCSLDHRGSASPGNFLELQILGPPCPPDLLNQKVWGWDPAICFTSPSGDSDIHVLLKPSGVSCKVATWNKEKGSEELTSYLCSFERPDFQMLAQEQNQSWRFAQISTYLWSFMNVCSATSYPLYSFCLCHIGLLNVNCVYFSIHAC